MRKGQLLFFVFFILSCLGANAQSTNPAPYCYPAALNMTGGTCTGTGGAKGSGFCFDSIKFKNIVQKAGCYGTGNMDVYRYWSATTSLTSGASDYHSMNICTPQCSAGNAISAGLWIDYNQNNIFEPSEFNSSSFTSNNNTVYMGIGFTVPCSAKGGKTRMRVMVVGKKKVVSSDSCGPASGYGETWDFDVTIVHPTYADASFTGPFPTQAYVKNYVSFRSNSDSHNYEYAWDRDNDGTYEQVNNYPGCGMQWTTPGTKCIKARVKNCFGVDSAVMCNISIIAPTQVPEADFTTCQRVIKMGYIISSFKGLSTNGAYNQNIVNIYDSSTYSQEPNSNQRVSSLFGGDGFVKWGLFNGGRADEYQFKRDGVYTVEYQAENDIGKSKLKIKKDYIRVVGDFYLGLFQYGSNNSRIVRGDYGRIMDKGAEDNSYANNLGVNDTRSYLVINPRAGRPIQLSFQQIRLKDIHDSIKIYNSDKMDETRLIGVLTSNNNGTYPVFKSSANKMVVYFSSDSSGVDSGFIATWSNFSNLYSEKEQKIDLGQSIVLVNQKAKFYNEGQTTMSAAFDKVWSVNDTIQNAFDNMDTLVHVFKYKGNQKVCLEMKSCDTTVKNCKNVVFANGIFGVVYQDKDSNCIINSADQSKGSIHLKLFDSTLNNWSHYYTNGAGEFNFNKTAGAYHLQIDTVDVPYRVQCKTSVTDSSFRLTKSDSLKKVNFIISCKNNGVDAGVSSVLTNGIVFPGRQHILQIVAGDINKLYSLNCISSYKGSVVITVNGKVKYIKPVLGALSPSSVNGNVLTYTISDFSKINNISDFELVFKTDTNATGNDKICVSVKVTITGAIDRDTLNNKYNWCYQVRNSYDPNLKEVHPAEIMENYKDWLTYTIHFQNTGSAPAFDIRLADTLDKNLDGETFQLLSNSHPVKTSLNGDVLSFLFKDISLPDSNTNEGGSHGFVQYRIKTKANVPKGVKIKNTAFIYFDYNSPVVTNTIVNEIYPNGVLIPDPAFAAWLTAKYPGCMRNGNIMDTACANIKKETSVDVSGKNIADLFGIQFFVSVKNLNCSGNQLTALSQLPSTIITMNCANNALKSLPALPSGLTDLDCSGNGLSALPSLPYSLKVLQCGNNQLISLPLLPSPLNKLYCSNNKINCFEKFSENLSALDIAGNTFKCLPNYINAMDAASKATPLCITGDAVNNPGNCNSTLTDLVFIPDMNFAAWLSAKFPACMHNTNWMDTGCSDIKNEQYLNVSGKGIANLFGVQFFVSLKGLNCSYNQLKALPALPVNLVQLVCNNNQLVTLPALPPGLVDFICDRNKLTTLPALPASITTLTCNDNKIIVLYALPKALLYFYCDSNYLASLPALPSGLNALSCRYNSISILPALPVALDNLWASYNQLASLPDLPSALTVLHCDHNKLTALPALPSGLKSIFCNNNQIVCFDKFSANIDAMDISLNNNKCLPNYISAMDAVTKSIPLCIKGDKQNNPDACPAPATDIKNVGMESAELMVYPNPGSGLYHVEWTGSLIGHQEMMVEVCDAIGNMVYSGKMINGSLMLDLRGAANGVYFMKVKGSDGSVVKALLKNR